MEKIVNCILLIDDDLEDNFIHKRVIKKSGKVAEIRTATNGLNALEYLNNIDSSEPSAEFIRPNIIFLDINMPKMDGFEFLEAYKMLSEEKRAEICIVMLTTSRNPQDMAKAGRFEEISNFSTKPLTQEALDVVIEEYQIKIGELKEMSEPPKL